MPIKVRCPNQKCGRKYVLKDEMAGKAIRCDVCQQVFRVPAQAAPAAPTPPAAPARVAQANVAQPPPAVPPQARAPVPPATPRVVARAKPAPAEDPQTLQLAPESAPAEGAETLQLAPETPRSAKKPEAPDPLLGKKLAHYQILAVLGQGGMGKVYRAKNIGLDKTCAIKILPKEFASQDPTTVERFLREARSSAKIEHPNVLPVYFVGKVEDSYFIEMQYVDGGTLQGMLKQQGRLDVREAARIVRDVAAGLSAAHEKGIVHRDIKPGNVMLTSKAHVFIMDFGLAKLTEAAVTLTKQGMVLGTPLYMSPEQATGRPLDHRTDIYSLGVMFFHMVTGAPPYMSSTAVEIVSQHIKSPVPDPTQLAPDVPPHLAAIIQRMMAKDPNERYPSCAELVQELDAFLTGGGSVFVPDAATPRASRSASARAAAEKGTPWGIILGLGAVTLALGAVGLYILVKMGAIKWPL